MNFHRLITLALLAATSLLAQAETKLAHDRSQKVPVQKFIIFYSLR